MLVIIWHLLADPEARYTDLGSDFHDTRINPERRKRNHIRQLEALGYKVILEPQPDPGSKPQPGSAGRCRAPPNCPIFGSVLGRDGSPGCELVIGDSHSALGRPDGRRRCCHFCCHPRTATAS